MHRASRGWKARRPNDVLAANCPRYRPLVRARRDAGAGIRAAISSAAGGRGRRTTARVGVFDDDAAKRSLTPPEAIAQLENNPDPVVRPLWVEMQSHIGRLERLKAALAAFRNCASPRRLLVLAGDFDFATARKAWQDFEPAVPTSADAIAIGILGLIIGWAATHLFVWPVRRHLQKRRERDLRRVASVSSRGGLRAGRRMMPA